MNPLVVVPRRPLLRLLLATLLTFAGFAALTVLRPSVARAGSEDCKDFSYSCTPGYTGQNASATWAWRYYGASYATTRTGYHNCTLYAAYRLAQNGLPDPGHSWGNAAEWAGRAGGGNHTPAVGSIAWWGTERGGGFGHVAYVEQVSGPNVFIRADNFSYTNGYTSSGWIPASSVDLFLHLRDLPTNAEPVGSFDAATSTSPGLVHVQGWAFDPDSATSRIHVHVYVGGPAGSGAAAYDLGPTGTARPDVQAVYPQAGPTTGFDATVPSNGGNVTLYLYGIDSAGGNNPLLGTRTVDVVDPNPQGYVDSASSPAGGLARVRGWAFDPSNPGTRIHVHVYVGGPAGSGAPGYDTGPTWVARPDVHAQVPRSGNYTGFDTTVPAPAGSVTLYVYGINVGTGSVNTFLGTAVAQVSPGPGTRPAPGAQFSRLPHITRRHAMTLAWHGLSGRPSPVTFDVRYQARSTRSGSTWTPWHAVTGAQNTTARSKSIALAGKRYYRFSVRVHSNVEGAKPSRWAASTVLRTA